jgi:ParB-like chromosome segregation protein Spo0J
LLLREHPKAAVISSPANIDIQIQRWPIERLKPYEGNARTHSNAQINQIAASMKEFGWTNPILVDGDGIIAVHARLLAAQKLGMKEVPVIVLAHLNEVQRRALVIADNQLALNAGWDEELLRVELAILHEGDYDLELLGFDDVELARLLAAQDAYPGLADEDAVLEPPAIPTSKARRFIPPRRPPPHLRRLHRPERCRAIAGRRQAKIDGLRSSLRNFAGLRMA